MLGHPRALHMATFSTSTLDSNGVQRVFHNTILDVRFIDVTAGRFAAPTRDFTGYAANGFWYEDGQPDVTQTYHTPFKAGWASEGEGDEYRGPHDSFPARVLLVTTPVEVVLLDADSLDVWMRFALSSGEDVGVVYGTCLGLVTASVYSADLLDGVLVIATDQGVRIADFRTDTCYILGESESFRGSGIISRNVDDGIDIDFGVTVTGDVSTHVSMGIGPLESGTFGPIAAIGHPGGLTALKLIDGVPWARKHPFVQTGGAWLAFDDLDGDETTPYFFDTGNSAETEWVNAGVRRGDVLVLVDGDHTIESIDTLNNVLVVTPEIDSSLIGDDYSIRRPVPVTLVTGGGKLYFGNGEQQVMHVADLVAWCSQVDDPEGAVLDVWTPSQGSVQLSSSTGLLQGITLLAGDLYAATEIGVFRCPADDFTRPGSPSAEHLYSASDAETAATYPILASGFGDCRAIAVDPETGHLGVASTDGVTAVLTEIDVSIQQAFRYESYDAIYSLCTYRNLQGPPDVEVS